MSVRTRQRCPRGAWLRRLVLAGAVVALGACGDDAGDVDAGAGSRAVTSLADSLGGKPDPGFARADAPRTFRFPRDHGPHPGFRNEWWYITGNLADEAGNRYGFQFTLFRVGLAPGSDDRDSAWATRDVWMAHFAVTDAATGRFHHFERFARGGDIGLAGARRAPVAVWLEDWRLDRRPDGTWRLRAAAGDVSLALSLVPRKAPVLQGDAGLSRKSGEPGNASYYYSLTRIGADGTLALDGGERAVAGSAWLDREWSTSALGPDQVGWDWFALQLDDGTDVMLYRLRRRNGTTSPWSAGVVVSPAGQVRHLGRDDFTLDVRARWTSPRGGTYPAGWRLTIDDGPGPLIVQPVLAEQELDAVVRYWEGAVDVRRDGERAGRGYVELTGYAQHRPGPRD